MRDNMGDHSHGGPNDTGTVAKAGPESLETFQDPGLPPHRKRLADTYPRAEKRAERQVAWLFVRNHGMPAAGRRPTWACPFSFARMRSAARS